MMNHTFGSVHVKIISCGLYYSLSLALSAFAIIFLVLFVNFALAAEVTLEWDRNSEPDIAEYWIFFGTASDTYTTHVEVDAAYTSCTISGLEEGMTYYFAAKAVNTFGEQSDFSNQVSTTIPFSDTGAESVPEGSGEDGYILEAYFDSGSNGFTYVDDTFRSTDQPYYAQGSWSDVGGSGAGALQVSLGGIDGADILGMSGGWERYFTLSQATEIEITFFYSLTQSATYESDELSQILVSVDGILHGKSDNDYVDQIVGNGERGDKETTGWQQCAINIGTLTAGEHSLIIGGYNNKKTYSNESTQVLIDDVIISGGTAAGGNSLPVSRDQSVSTDENTAVSVTLIAQDYDNDPLSYTLVSNPSNGRLTGTAPNLTYTPNIDYVGSDSFTFKANDGYADSNVARVTITVNATTSAEESSKPSKEKLFPSTSKRWWRR